MMKITYTFLAFVLCLLFSCAKQEDQTVLDFQSKILLSEIEKSEQTLNQIEREVRMGGTKPSDTLIFHASISLRDSITKFVSHNDIAKASSLIEAVYNKERLIDSSFLQEIAHFKKLFEETKDSFYQTDEKIVLYKGLNIILNNNFQYVSGSHCHFGPEPVVGMVYSIEKGKNFDSIEVCLLPNIAENFNIMSFTKKNGIRFYNLKTKKEIPFTIKHIGHVTLIKALVTKGEYKLDGKIFLQIPGKDYKLECIVLEKIII
ncbi:MAG: hypothetical protein JWM14_529 [Chitinophagaceae bacterium]|nr:hypothetical protein [Chitinophagaceae bacterium]